MGLIARIKNTSINDGILSALVEIFKNDNASARIFNPPGIDSRPLDGDIGFSEDSGDTEGGKDVLGFIDLKNLAVSEKGEVKIYSRDSSGNIKAAIHIKADGSIEINAPAGLKITANTEITGTLTVSGIIKSLVDIIADYAATAITLLTHFHKGNLGFPTETPIITGGGTTPTNPPSIDGNNIVDGNGTKTTEHSHTQGNDSAGDSQVTTGNAS